MTRAKWDQLHLMKTNWGQVCEAQEARRDVARIMGDQLNTFLSLSLDVSELQERELSRQAVAVMLHLIKDISDYFLEHTGKGAFGDVHFCYALYRPLTHAIAEFLRAKKHQERIEHFKNQFELAKDQFDRNMQVETLQMVFELCKLPDCILYYCFLMEMQCNMA